MTEYDIILKREILREAFSGLLTNFSEIMENKNIDDDDKDNPFVILYWQLNYVHQNIIGPRYKTMQDMIEVQGQYKFFKQYLKNINQFHK